MTATEQPQPPSTEFAQAFEELKSILQKYESKLALEANAPDKYILNTTRLGPNRKPMFFGSVLAEKNYVAFHLMPIYVFPDLLDDVSDELRRKMQGKSCFNFKATDAKLFKELTKLTKAGFERFRKSGMA